jgi:hypothetical protein
MHIKLARVFGFVALSVGAFVLSSVALTAAARTVIDRSPSLSLSLSRSTALVGERATVSWSADGVDGCEASAFPSVRAASAGNGYDPLDWGFGMGGPTSGQQEVSTGISSTTVLYSMTCKRYSTGATISKTAFLDVSFANPGVIDSRPGTVSGSNPKINVFTVDRQSVNPGESATLIWSSSGAEKCLASNNPYYYPMNEQNLQWYITTYGPLVVNDAPEWNGPKKRTGSFVVTPRKAGLHIYSLHCTNEAGLPGKEYSQVVFLQVTEKPIVTANVSSTVIKPGESITVSWKSSRATSCTAWTTRTTRENIGTPNPKGEGWDGPIPTEGVATVTPKYDGVYRYYISCDGPSGTGGGIFSAVTVALPGDTSPVMKKALEPEIRFGIEEVSGGNSKPLSVSYPSPTVSGTIDPRLSYASIYLGESVKLSWDVDTNGTDTVCSGIYMRGGNYPVGDGLGYMNGDIVRQKLPLSGSVWVTPGIADYRQYEIQCETKQWVVPCNGVSCLEGRYVTNTKSGFAHFSVVGQNPGDVPLPTVSLSASTLALAAGEGSSLSWSSAGASECAAYSLPVDAAWNGLADAPSAPAAASSGLGVPSASFAATSADSASLDWVKSTSGEQSVTPASAGAATYGMICRGPGGSASASVALSVAPGALSVGLSASPSTVDLGASSTLAWSAPEASSCAASSVPYDPSWSGAKAVSGSQSVTPASLGSAAYSISCQNTYASASTATAISVQPVPEVIEPVVAPVVTEPVVDIFSLSAVPSIASFRFKGDKPANSDPVTLRVNRADAVGPITLSVEGVSPALPEGVVLDGYSLGGGSAPHVLADDQNSAIFTATLNKKIPGACASTSATGCVSYYVTFKATDSAGKSASAQALLSGVTLKPGFTEF